MANKFYPHYILNEIMRDDREAAGLSQSTLGMAIGKTQKAVSDIENGYVNPAPETMIRWFTALKAYEHIDLVQYMYDLHPLAAIPIDPGLNDDAGDAIINLSIQIDEAEEKLRAIQLWISNLRPRRISSIHTEDFQQVYDVYKALQTFLYASIREFNLDIGSITDSWSRKAISQCVAMEYSPKRKAAF